jgi:hypothetical protein
MDLFESRGLLVQQVGCYATTGDVARKPACGEGV